MQLPPAHLKNEDNQYSNTEMFDTLKKGEEVNRYLSKQGREGGRKGDSNSQHRGTPVRKSFSKREQSHFS